jgi:hypothetical protein
MADGIVYRLTSVFFTGPCRDLCPQKYVGLIAGVSFPRENHHTIYIASCRDIKCLGQVYAKSQRMASICMLIFNMLVFFLI